MENLIRVAVDAMGGDYAPTEAVKGAVAAVNEKENVEVLLVGKQEVIEKELSACSYPSERIRVINASQVIETGEPPVAAIRGKKDSSIVVGMKMVKQQEADAFVSAGSSGAILVGGTTIVGRIRGVERAPLAPLIPTKTGVSHRLRRQRRRQSFSSGAVCQDGLHLYGTCSRCEKAPSRYCEYRCGRGKGKCPG